MSCYIVARMPNMDLIRREGLTIDGAYSQTRCGPSRIAFMTGKYPHTVGNQGDVVGNTDDPHGIPLSIKYFPEHLQKNGYDTHFYGKWHLGFCDQRLRPNHRGFDSAFGFMGAGIGYNAHVGDQIPGKSSKYHDYWRNDDSVEGMSYCTDDYINEFNQMIDKRIDTKDTDPFFVYMSFNAPHAPHSAPDEAYLKRHKDSPRKDYWATLTRMDWNVGRMVDKLRESGDFENTIFIYQSDNGDKDGTGSYPLRGMKSSFAEGGTRVPAFIAGPGIRKGTLDRLSFIHLSDWGPTILDLAGIDPKTGFKIN